MPRLYFLLQEYSVHISQKTWTMFVGVVTHLAAADNGVTQLPQHSPLAKEL